MKILVTGGAGFIGSHIVDRYVETGHDVVVVDDLSNGSSENIRPGVRFHRISVNDPAFPGIVASERPEVVNHHAAQSDMTTSLKDPPGDARINLLGSLNVLEACRRHGVKKILFASSGGAIYGNQHRFPADEDHPPCPVNPYGIAKMTVEYYLEFYARRFGLSSVALRYSNVYGPRQKASGESGVVAIFVARLLQGRPPVICGTGEQTRDYVYVDDVVACNAKALEDSVGGRFNVASGIETDVNTVARHLEKIMRLNIPPLYAPERQGETKRSCLRPGSLQTLPPTPLPEGLERTVAWFKGG